VPEIKEKSEEDCPQILIGNKRDMPNERAVSSETAKQLSESIGIRYF
jgi:GTPase SAR1 family protein